MKLRDAFAAAFVVAAGVGIGLSISPDAVEDTPARQGARQAVLVGMGHAIPAAERLPESINSVALTMPTPVADAAGFDAVWGAIYCDPLAPVKDEPATLFDACVAQQVGSLGPLLCLADGTPAGHVTRIQATPALAERASTLAGEVPVEWVACPQSDM